MPVAQYVKVWIEKSIVNKTMLTVVRHEIPVLGSVWGTEQIHIKAGTEDGVEFDPQSEWTRLEQNYGVDENGRSHVLNAYPLGVDQMIEMASQHLPVSEKKQEQKEDKPVPKRVTIEKTSKMSPLAEEPQENVIEKPMLLAKLKEWGISVAANTGKPKLTKLLEETALARLEAAGITDIEHMDLLALVSMADDISELKAAEG